MTGRPVPRDVQAAIVGELARMTRTASQIADRHRVPLGLVVKLRETHGPDPVALAAAAKRLQRPESHGFTPKPAPKPEPVVEPVDEPANNIPAEIPTDDPGAGLVAFDKPKRGAYSDGLSKDERAIVRAWATSTPGAPQPGIQGQIRRDCVEAWEAAGRPQSRAFEAVGPEGEELVGAAPLSGSWRTCACSHAAGWHWADSPAAALGVGPCQSPGCVCTEYRRHDAAPETSAPVEGGEASPAPTQDEDAADALAAVEIAKMLGCGSCGGGVDEYGICRQCDAEYIDDEPDIELDDDELEPVSCACGCLTHTDAAGKGYIEWARAYDEAMQIPELATECQLVADAVEMLRDAKAEHERRAPMLDAIKVELNALLACVPEIPRADFERVARRILDVVG